MQRKNYNCSGFYYTKLLRSSNVKGKWEQVTLKGGKKVAKTRPALLSFDFVVYWNIHFVFNDAEAIYSSAANIRIKLFIGFLSSKKKMFPKTSEHLFEKKKK